MIRKRVLDDAKEFESIFRVLLEGFIDEARAPAGGAECG